MTEAPRKPPNCLQVFPGGNGRAQKPPAWQERLKKLKELAHNVCLSDIRGSMQRIARAIFPGVHPLPVYPFRIDSSPFPVESSEDAVVPLENNVHKLANAFYELVWEEYKERLPSGSLVHYDVLPGGKIETRFAIFEDSRKVRSPDQMKMYESDPLQIEGKDFGLKSVIVAPVVLGEREGFPIMPAMIILISLDQKFSDEDVFLAARLAKSFCPILRDISPPIHRI